MIQALPTAKRARQSAGGGAKPAVSELRIQHRVFRAGWCCPKERVLWRKTTTIGATLTLKAVIPLAFASPGSGFPPKATRAWQAFVMFRDSEKRSLTEIAESSQFDCSVSNVSRWCVVHRWRDRAFAFDADRDEKEREQLARDRMAMRRRHLKLALTMQSIAAHGLQELQEKIKQGLPLNMTAGESNALMDAGVKLERVTLGGEGRESRYTKIVVNLGDAPDDPDEDQQPLLDGDKSKPN
jgi:hypothetical protein